MCYVFFFFLLELTCTDPGNIQHGAKSHGGFEYGKEVKYRCLPGFTMEGSNTLTCTGTGDWDRVKPSCTCKRTNKQAFRFCRKSCNPASSSCSKDRECVCDGDCGYSCLPKGSYSRAWGIFSLSRAWKKEKVLSFRNDSNLWRPGSRSGALTTELLQHSYWAAWIHWVHTWQRSSILLRTAKSRTPCVQINNERWPILNWMMGRTKIWASDGSYPTSS